VIEFGWHLLQIPRGHGGWSLQPVFMRQLMSSNCINLPLRQIYTSYSRTSLVMFIIISRRIFRTYQLRQWASWDTNEKTSAWYFVPSNKSHQKVPEVSSERSILSLHADNCKNYFSFFTLILTLNYLDYLQFFVAFTLNFAVHFP